MHVLTNVNGRPDLSTESRATGNTGKQVSLRLGQIALMRLTSLAVLDDNAVADQLRAAFDKYVEQRMSESEISDGMTALRLLEGVDQLAADSPN